MLSVCASFDKRNIADYVLNNAHLYRDHQVKNAYRMGLFRFWRQYLNVLLHKEDEGILDTLFMEVFTDLESVNISKDTLKKLLEEFIRELFLRVYELAVTDMSALDAVLEIADFGISENEYMQLTDRFMSNEKESY